MTAQGASGRDGGRRKLIARAPSDRTDRTLRIYEIRKKGEGRVGSSGVDWFGLDWIALEWLELSLSLAAASAMRTASHLIRNFTAIVL